MTTCERCGWNLPRFGCPYNDCNGVDLASKLRAQKASSTDPERLERMARAADTHLVCGGPDQVTGEYWTCCGIRSLRIDGFTFDKFKVAKRRSEATCPRCRSGRRYVGRPK